MMGLAQIAIALCALVAGIDASAAIGVNYGRLGDNLPPPAEVVQLYQKNGITKMRLFDPDIAVIEALRKTGIYLTLGIRNQDLQTLSTSMDAVNVWFATNIEPYLNDVVFEYIVVGNELVPGDLANYILPVMQNFQTLLNARDLNGISMTTCVATTVFATSFPPSQSVFSDQSREVITGILGFLSAQANPLLINLYPYFAYASDPVNIRLDYAQFTATGIVVQDGSLGYSNMLDAMIDAFSGQWRKWELVMWALWCLRVAGLLMVMETSQLHHWLLLTIKTS